MNIEDLQLSTPFMIVAVLAGIINPRLGFMALAGLVGIMVLRLHQHGAFWWQ